MSRSGAKKWLQSGLQQWVEQTWYGGGVASIVSRIVLSPLSLLFCSIVVLRRRGYQWGLFERYRPSVPLVVVGNLSVGGTGKTPLVVTLVDELKQLGFKPAVVSRGYGREDEQRLLEVQPEAHPAEVGDEPLLIAQRTGAIVVVARDRAAAAAYAVERGATVLVADDGLQHYRLQRDLEIVVVDHQRNFGNRLCLPAGPLREPLSRLQQVDAVVYNGMDGGNGRGYSMQLVLESLYLLRDKNQTILLAELCGQKVHAVAGIGNPERFFKQLEESGLEVIPHPYPDHYQYNSENFEFMDDYPVVTTEKDAVKCVPFQDLLTVKVWVAPVHAEVDQGLKQLLKQKLNQINQMYNR
ncbi:MAG: tetraacyldisaccharide 4'-kinase [Gammaproteobacteria bacterium]|nr:tetraacyldisaccharide 4'-kinase [Gammaproteobacteria bacterium]MBT3718534.1 tetraacyldisaccharide 4'-kinase [Gammaproteobacteria bacterium]MBT3846022.1 tetraacyldisaccharide 4'-kinase [Gammaproteobacteria bacterium]MBT3892731.1 tetraacyldisaccharide 4'-kinase [Gammaproteobacteria bacterium]MBT4299961.1 tetraacyldisaccharide 4'-kinase [Gammaproteobacteria bacterium]